MNAAAADRATPRSIDLDTYLDGLKFSSFHLRALILGVIIMLVDGYEVGVIGLVLPALSEDLGVSRVSLTWVMSAQQVGMVLGAYFIVPLADRFGREPLALCPCCGWGRAASPLFTQTVSMCWRPAGS